MLATLLLLLPPGAAPQEGPPGPTAVLPAETTATLVRVVDGDTLEVRLEGEVVSLRLLSVDTEEKISGHPGGSPTKPQTVFGQETTLWARAFFAALPQPARVGLVFPEGRRRDAFGRLLCHVLLPDGRDYNLLLVELGKSPYFNKYGNSTCSHQAFVRAQDGARAARRGVWDPATNRARTPGALSAIRPYDRLLPWWEARAAAIEVFRARRRKDPEALLASEDPPALERALRGAQADPGRRVTVFTEIERFYEERDGSLTVLLRGGEADTALRAVVPAASRPAVEPRLRALVGEFRQNFVYVTGRMERNTRGFVLVDAEPADWRVADPAFPPRDAR